MTTPATAGKSQTPEARRWALFADLLRIVLVARHGGFWMDADTLALPPIAHLAPLVVTRPFVGQETHKGDVMNGCFGGCPNSTVLQALAQTLQNHLSAKREAGDLTAHWGEYGKALFTQVLLRSDLADLTILPHGTLSQIHPETALDPLQSTAPIGSFLPPTALAITLFNSVLGADDMPLSRDAILASDTILSQAFALAISGENGPCRIETPNQIATLNRAGATLNCLHQIEKLRQARSELQGKLDRQRDKIQSLKTANQKLRSRTDNP